MRFLWISLLFVATLVRAANPAFTFEGDVDYADPVLEPELGPPRVLAGTLELALAEWNTADQAESGDVEFYNVVRNGELTLDRNYVLSAEGRQTDDINFVTIIDGEEREQEDRVVISLRMTGDPLPRCGFFPTTLTLVLADKDGAMLHTNTLFSDAPAFESATFALEFSHAETGEKAWLKGTLTVFANWQREVTAEEDYRQLEDQIHELDQKLAARDAMISQLQTALAQAREQARAQADQLAALEAERARWESGEAVQALQAANAELQDQLKESRAAREFSAGAVAQMTVRNERMAQAQAELVDRNAGLSTQLADSLARIDALEAQLDALTASSPSTEITDTAASVIPEPAAAAPEEADAPPAPPLPDETVATSSTMVESPEMTGTTEATLDTEPAAEDETASTTSLRRRGPRR